MRIVQVITSAILVMEFVLHGLAMLTGMKAGIQPIIDHLGFRPDRAFTLMLGAIDLAVATTMIVGFWKPGFGALGAGYALVLFATLMILRLYRRLGTLVWPPDFPLFFILSAMLLFSQLALAQQG